MKDLNMHDGGGESSGGHSMLTEENRRNDDNLLFSNLAYLALAAPICEKDLEETMDLQLACRISRGDLYYWTPVCPIAGDVLKTHYRKSRGTLDLFVVARTVFESNVSQACKYCVAESLIIEYFRLHKDFSVKLEDAC